MTQTIRTHVPVPGLGPDCDVHVRTAPQQHMDGAHRSPCDCGPDTRPLDRLAWLGVYSHTRKTWIFPCTQQSVTAALAAAKVVLR